MEDFGERAVDFFSKGYNCSQSTAAAFAEYYKKRLCAHFVHKAAELASLKLYEEKENDLA